MTTMYGTVQDEVNRAIYHQPNIWRYYHSRDLVPAEVACFLKYQPFIAGRDVLDVGVGAGRTTRYLEPIARRYEAVDYSPVMVEHVREAFPRTHVQRADFRALTPFEDATFDFVLASDNVIDALSHEDRMRALAEARRVLRPGGLLAFSSHNVEYAHAHDGPTLAWTKNPFTLARRVADLVTMIKNHRRVSRHRRVTPEYAILNDSGQNFACLHYYASREAVRAQLERVGMRLLDVFDVEGRTIDDAPDAKDDPSLLYVAQAPARRGDQRRAMTLK